MKIGATGTPVLFWHQGTSESCSALSARVSQRSRTKQSHLQVYTQETLHRPAEKTEYECSQQLYPHHPKPRNTQNIYLQDMQMMADTWDGILHSTKQE
jgi:hypothetical protein